MNTAFLLGQHSTWCSFWQLLLAGFRTFCKHHLCHTVDTAGIELSNLPSLFANPFFNNESGRALELLKVIQRLAVVVLKVGISPLCLSVNNPSAQS